MRSEYSVDLLVGPDARKRLLVALRRWCAPAYQPVIDAALRDPTMTSFAVCLVLPPEPSIQQVAVWYPSPIRVDATGMIVVGMIDSWLERSRTEAVGREGWRLRLWPATGTVQQCLMQSSAFWQRLVRLLEEADGQMGLLDDASGAAAEIFWSPETGPIMRPEMPPGTFDTNPGADGRPPTPTPEGTASCRAHKEDRSPR